jgi:hypothetical protein
VLEACSILLFQRRQPSYLRSLGVSGCSALSNQSNYLTLAGHQWSFRRYIVPQSDCISNEADGQSYMSNTTIERLLILKAPDAEYIHVLDGLAASNVNARVQCTSERSAEGAMQQVQLTAVKVDSRVPDNLVVHNPRTPWCKSVLSFTASVLATSDDPTQAYLQRHRLCQAAKAHTKHQPENVARFTATEMTAALAAIEQAELRSYRLAYHWCTTQVAQTMCEIGSGIDAGLNISLLSPADLGWQKHQGGTFRATAGERLWGRGWEAQHSEKLQTVIVLGLPADITDVNIDTMMIPEMLLTPDDNGHMVYSNAFVRKVYTLQASESASFQTDAVAENSWQQPIQTGIDHASDSEDSWLSELPNAELQPLPAEWEERFTDDSEARVYFVNTRTGQSTWSRPQAEALSRPLPRRGRLRPPPDLTGYQLEHGLRSAALVQQAPAAAGRLHALDPASPADQLFLQVHGSPRGELMYEELENWWLRQGGALNRLQNVRIAFRLIENRDGVPGCCPDEFSEAVVHAGQEDWDNLPPTPHDRWRYVNRLTGERRSCA